MKTIVAASAVAVALLTAGTASAQDLRIAYGDLDLSTALGARQFDRRVDRAIRAACAGGSRLQTLQCGSALRAEIETRLPGVHRDQYARARTGSDKASAAPSVR